MIGVSSRRRPFPWRAAALAAAVLLCTTREGSVTADATGLTAADVRAVISQAAAEAQAAGLPSVIAVTDDQGVVIGLFRMTGAPATSRVPGVMGQGLQGMSINSDFLAATKAATGALLSSGGNAFSTRTASFIVQDHTPPLVDFTPGGPLFGVQFSSLPCSDFRLPFFLASPVPNVGLAGDPGGMPLYKSGIRVGGVGVEGDGVYGVDANPADREQPPEERIAVAGTRGFEAPDPVRADNILVDGVRLPYAYAVAQVLNTVAAAPGQNVVAPRDAAPSRFVPATVGGISGRMDPRYPFRAGAVLSADDVGRAIAQGAQQTVITRAAIRQPLGSNARVSLAVVDLNGDILGFFQNDDAPNFGQDVAVQKARTANFFSSPTARAELQAAGFAAFLQDSSVPLDGSIAWSSRGIGFLAQPFFPPGINGTDPGPFSVPTSEWSPFDTGLQLELVRTDLLTAGSCSRSIPKLRNGITIFPGGIPLYKGGALAGAIGISGDGVDQDDLIAAAGSAGFEAPPERRCDTLLVRGVRIPYQKFPRHPDL
jgi:uncharacterized protein GlcG (DUF336 family)